MKKIEEESELERNEGLEPAENRKLHHKMKAQMKKRKKKADKFCNKFCFTFWVTFPSIM